jgi:hypothetical protein
MYVDVNSSNVSALVWPFSSTAMFFQDNETLDLTPGTNAFLNTSYVHEVLSTASDNGFWGKAPVSTTNYNLAWESTVNTTTGEFSFVPVNVSQTQLQDLQLYNSRSQLFMASTSPNTATFDNIESVGQFIVNVLNGPVFKEQNLPSYTCPCQNEASSAAHCSWGAWNFIAQQINLTLTNKVQSLMAPCMNPGNTMFVNEGVGSIFNVTAQIKRIRNLDRIRFRTVNATPKSCENSVLYSFAAVTCGELERDECPSADPQNTITGCSAGVLTKLGLDFSIQATILGTNVLDSSRLCDNLTPILAGEHCPLEGGQCLEVFLPLMLVNMTLEVPVVYGGSEPLDTYCASKSQNSLTKGYFPRFDLASISMGLALSEKPIIQYPTSTNIIPDEYRTFIETTVMDAANSVFRNSLDQQFTEAFSPFFQKAFGPAPLLDILPQCVNLEQPSIVMACPPNEIVLPPVQCDPCDFCCICFTGGDCGEKCTQRCGCVNTFCQAVDRIAYPIWWKLVIVIFILMVVLMVLFGGFIRGIQR